MISIIIGVIWLMAIIWPINDSEFNDKKWPWLVWGLLSLLWIIPIFTGINVKSSDGQYKGYVLAVEHNGAIFKGYTAYLKTDLTSSDEDVACVNRDDKELIEKLKVIQERKENVVLEYESVWQYKIGECPNADWKIIGIK